MDEMAEREASLRAERARAEMQAAALERHVIEHAGYLSRLSETASRARELAQEAAARHREAQAEMIRAERRALTA